MTITRLEDMSDLVRSRGKKTEQCTHCAVERSLLFANSATSPAHGLGASRYTCSYTREGNPMLAHNAATQCTQADDLKKRLLAHSGEKPFVHTTFWLLTV